MNIAGWNYFYKYKDGQLQSTNLLYTPYVNPEGTVLCMSWDETDPYQAMDDKNISKDLVNFFFEREVNNITNFQNNIWCPKLYDIDLQGRKIFIEWNNQTLNHLFHERTNLDQRCVDWKNQISKIVEDIINIGYMKMALYPHCFYINDENIIKTFDFYSCVAISEPFIKIEKIQNMIGEDSGNRFSSASIDGNIDFRIFFSNTLHSYLCDFWKDDLFSNILKKIERKIYEYN